ncbi:hypothetical protein AB4Y32_27385, partial [Paraburkholderia phymatum]
HTCRLLVFKEHSHEAPCLRCVAASAAEKGDYEEPSGIRQQVFASSLETPPTTPPRRFCRGPRRVAPQTARPSEGRES